MESSGFDDQIFNDFSGPLSPLGAKAIQATNGHSIQVVLGPNDYSASANVQRLPQVDSLLSAGSPSYKNIDYSHAKYESQYSPNNNNNNKIEYVSTNGRIDYSPTSHHQKIDYANKQMFQQPQSIDSTN